MKNYLYPALITASLFIMALTPSISPVEAPDCPNDSCYGGKLYSTYKTEYCVGAKCRERTLYKCNINPKHKYWIYKD